MQHSQKLSSLHCWLCDLPWMRLIKRRRWLRVIMLFVKFPSCSSRSSHGCCWHWREVKLTDCWLRSGTRASQLHSLRSDHYLTALTSSAGELVPVRVIPRGSQFSHISFLIIKTVSEVDLFLKRGQTTCDVIRHVLMETVTIQVCTFTTLTAQNECFAHERGIPTSCWYEGWTTTHSPPWFIEQIHHGWMTVEVFRDLKLTRTFRFGWRFK